MIKKIDGVTNITKQVRTAGNKVRKNISNVPELRSVFLKTQNENKLSNTIEVIKDVVFEMFPKLDPEYRQVYKNFDKKV